MLVTVGCLWVANGIFIFKRWQRRHYGYNVTTDALITVTMLQCYNGLLLQVMYKINDLSSNPETSTLYTCFTTITLTLFMYVLVSNKDFLEFINVTSNATTTTL